MLLDIAELESSIENALELADLELQERQIQEERRQRIVLTKDSLITKFTSLIEKIDKRLGQYATIENLNDTDSVSRKRLQEQKGLVENQLANVELLAAEIVDAELLKKEQQLIDRHSQEELLRWREGLRDDILDMIAEQTNFFDATDAALSIKGHISELKAIGALDAVTRALVDKINSLSRQGAVAKHRATDEATILFIADMAERNRERCEHPRQSIQPKSTNRKTDTRPDPFADLKGKVVVAGGHAQLKANVCERLKGAAVEIDWVTADGGVKEARSAAKNVAGADCVFIITAYAGRMSTAPVQNAAKKAEIPVKLIQTTGMSSVLEAISLTLRTKQLVSATRKRA